MLPTVMLPQITDHRHRQQQKKILLTLSEERSAEPSSFCMTQVMYVLRVMYALLRVMYVLVRAMYVLLWVIYVLLRAMYVLLWVKYVLLRDMYVLLWIM